MIIHYMDDGFGLVVGINAGIDIPGTKTARLVNDLLVQCGTHRYDPAYGALIPLTQDQLAILNVPSDHDVNRRVEAELYGTDKLVNVPDFPLEKTGGDVAAWQEYRRLLRRLSDHGSPMTMIENWPARPDGRDPIPDLRQRLADAHDAQRRLH